MNHEHLKEHIAKYDYIEGEKARENFEQLARTVFQAKRKAVLPKAKDAQKRVSRPRKSGKA